MRIVVALVGLATVAFVMHSLDGFEAYLQTAAEALAYVNEETRGE